MKVPPLNLRREDVPDLSTGERTEKLLHALNAFGAAAEPLLNGGLTLKDNVRAFAKEITFTGGVHTIGASNEPAFENSWVAFGGATAVPSFTRSAGRVHIHGSVKDGTIDSAAFTLPAGYRPSATVGFAVSCGVAPAFATISAAGAVTIGGAAGVPAAGVSLDGVHFDAADPTIGTDAPFPIRIKNEIGAPPSHVWVTRAVDVTDSRSSPVALGALAWSVSGDQIVIHDVGNLLAGRKIKATILVVAE